MRYSIEIIRKNEQNTSEWSGGTTTELAIYPKGASYSDRNFVWRLSSANVDLEESTFTSLPDIWRYIMVIEGEMDLEHAGHHKVHLKPYEQDSFSGEWVTKSMGRVIDFNLMLGEGYKGKIESIYVTQEVNINESHVGKNGSITQTFYCTEGEFQILVNENQYASIYKGDLIIVTLEDEPENIDIKIVNKSSKFSRVIKASIYNKHR